jgi:16S rRNA (cytosine967-C5)-methyltransferase
MNPRLAAAKALAAVLSGKASLNSSLPTQLDKVEDRDRGFTQDLAFGTARWQPRLSALAARLLQKPFKAADADVEALLLVGLYQLLYTRVPAHAAIGETVGCADKLKKPWAKALLNAVLRRAQRESEAMLAELEHDPVVRTAHPRWLQKSLKAFWPEQWEAICAANNAHPPMILRVNRRHHTRDAYLGLLGDDRHRRQRMRLQSRRHHPRRRRRRAQPAGIRRRLDQRAGRSGATGCRPARSGARPTGTRRLLRTGRQDLPHPRSRAGTRRRGGRGPGSQASGTGARKPRTPGLSAELIAADGRDTPVWWDGKPFQRILLDAPCSATGVIRRHPDIKLTRQADDIAALAVLQGELLDAMWKTLEVGGILLYATCSTLPTENTEVIEAFLARTPGARELDLATTAGIKQPHGRQLLAQEGGHDGFYYAKLIKIAAARG